MFWSYASNQRLNGQGEEGSCQFFLWKLYIFLLLQALTQLENVLHDLSKKPGKNEMNAAFKSCCGKTMHVLYCIFDIYYL